MGTLAAALAGILGACSPAPKPAVLVVLPGEYERAFDATREVLDDFRFRLERVDAAGGVITTQPRSTAGFATPWDTDQTTLYQEWEDLANQQQRVVRVTFAPEGEEDNAAPGEAYADRRADDSTLVARFEVDVLRVRRPGWRIETESVTRSTRYLDPPTAARSGGATFYEPVGQDEHLAGRIAAGVAQRLGGAEAEPTAAADATD
ncbi:MAG: hypothetical protein DHS20C14_17450 [Phycisphaeraceae bacterium]|nr:MAG: hypothetical protein DHS20C14_17450 [Phycisphaeraceae bacterium]